MSTQSIIHNSKDSLSEKADKLYMTMGYKFLMKRCYGVGVGFDKHTYMKVKWMERLMCEENCLLCEDQDLIKEKLNLLILNC